MNFLLIGADGQLGQELRHSLALLGEVFPLTRRELDLSQPEKLEEVIYTLKPDAIIN
ncbi:MAG: sugar nucleotide-binding protein, partial [Microcystaceae cyanobacterium]